MPTYRAQPPPAPALSPTLPGSLPAIQVAASARKISAESIIRWSSRRDHLLTNASTPPQGARTSVRIAPPAAPRRRNRRTSTTPPGHGPLRAEARAPRKGRRAPPRSTEPGTPPGERGLQSALHPPQHRGAEIAAPAPPRPAMDPCGLKPALLARQDSRRPAQHRTHTPRGSADFSPHRASHSSRTPESLHGRHISPAHGPLRAEARAPWRGCRRRERWRTGVPGSRAA